MKAGAATKEAVLRVLSDYGDAIARHDADAAFAVFTGDADCMVMGSNGGEWAVGRPEVHGFFQAALKGDAKFSLEWARTEVFSSGSVAWFGADGALTAGQTRIPYRLSGVLEERGGTWKLAQFHGSVPQ